MTNINVAFVSFFGGVFFLWKYNPVVYVKRYCIVVQDICSPRALQTSTTCLLV